MENILKLPSKWKAKASLPKLAAVNDFMFSYKIFWAVFYDIYSSAICKYMYCGLLYQKVYIYLILFIWIHHNLFLAFSLFTDV